MTLMSLNSGTLNFYEVCRFFEVAWVKNGRDTSLAVLSFHFVSFLILSDDSFYHPAIYRSKSGLKRFLIGCSIRDN